MIKCINKKYPLGPKYRGIVLNQREAVCMRYLLRNFSIEQIAWRMRLSVRTVGFYIGNVMLLLNCGSLQELMKCIRESELMRHFD